MFVVRWINNGIDVTNYDIKSEFDVPRNSGVKKKIRSSDYIQGLMSRGWREGRGIVTRTLNSYSSFWEVGGVFTGSVARGYKL